MVTNCVDCVNSSVMKFGPTKWIALFLCFCVFLTSCSTYDSVEVKSARHAKSKLKEGKKYWLTMQNEKVFTTAVIRKDEESMLAKVQPYERKGKQVKKDVQYSEVKKLQRIQDVSKGHSPLAYVGEVVGIIVLTPILLVCIAVGGCDMK